MAMELRLAAALAFIADSLTEPLNFETSETIRLPGVLSYLPVVLGNSK